MSLAVRPTLLFKSQSHSTAAGSRFSFWSHRDQSICGYLQLLSVEIYFYSKIWIFLYSGIVLRCLLPDFHLYLGDIICIPLINLILLPFYGFLVSCLVTNSCLVVRNYSLVLNLRGITRRFPAHSLYPFKDFVTRLLNFACRRNFLRFKVKGHRMCVITASSMQL